MCYRCDTGVPYFLMCHRCVTPVSVAGCATGVNWCASTGVPHMLYPTHMWHTRCTHVPQSTFYVSQVCNWCATPVAHLPVQVNVLQVWHRCALLSCVPHLCVTGVQQVCKHRCATHVVPYTSCRVCHRCVTGVQAQVCHTCCTLHICGTPGAHLCHTVYFLCATGVQHL